jgi:hypothetical protein
MKIPITYFEHPNMADVWVGKYCIENNIMIVSIAHKDDFLTYQPQKTTIFDTESNSDSVQTKIVNSVFNMSDQIEIIVNEVPLTHTKIESTLEKTQKQINYDKVNSVFSVNPKVVPFQQPNPQANTLKLNSETLSKLQKPKKRFR